MVKSVRVTDEVHTKLLSIMEAYSIKTLGGAVNYAVNQLFLSEDEKGRDDSGEVSVLKNELKVYKDLVDFYKKLELERATHPSTIINNYGHQGNVPTPSTNTLKAPPKPPRKHINYKPPNTANIRKDYQTEIKQVFNGDTIKPSEIIGITKPKHKDSDIRQLKEDEEPPPVNWLGEKIQEEMRELKKQM